ncbi:MAG: protein translocase subunit SecD, partial [Nakamurella sp.]
MATPAGQFRPWRLIGTFIGIVAVLYGLVFFTPGPNTPKLGIDLQGGTRITLTARTLDGSDPTRAQMQQAQAIMESRVNGSGVVGAEVQIDGARTLVITVPGNEDLNSLTRSAQMNIRPVLTDSSGNPVISYPAGYVPPSAAATTGASASGSATGTAESSAVTTIPAIGDTTAPSTPGDAAT